MTEQQHICAYCSKSVPSCGNKRRVKEGYCTKFKSEISLKETIEHLEDERSQHREGPR